MGRVLINNIGISSYGLIYSSVKRVYCSSLSGFGYKNESVVCKCTITLKSEKLATQLWIFQLGSSLF